MHILFCTSIISCRLGATSLVWPLCSLWRVLYVSTRLTTTTSGQLKITNDKKTGMGDALTATIATSVEYGIIFSGNKSTLMMLFCRDARCEQHKIRCSHYFLCYFDGDERDAQALYGLRSRSLRLFPSRHIIPPLCRKQTCFLQPLEVSQALHSGVSLCHRGTDTA